MGRKSRPLEQRFWEKVSKSVNCWEWSGALNSGGYGILEEYKDGPQLRAHRVSWELHIGDIPSHLIVCHRCDNRRCVRPAHLFLGTKADNTADMMEKHRHRCAPVVGSKHYKAKLTEANVAEILQRLRGDETQLQIANDYGVSKTMVSRIHRRLSWKHITGSKEESTNDRSSCTGT